MLELMFALVLAGAGPNDPGLGNPGLDRRAAGLPALQVAGASGSGGRGVGPAGSRPEAVATGEWDVVDVVITEAERRIFRDYFHQHPCALYGCDGRGSLPPGLARRESLPPGLARQLARNGTLPPGLAKRALPDDLVQLLPARGSRHRFVMVDDRVLLVERATNVILDALEIVLDADG